MTVKSSGSPCLRQEMFYQTIYIQGAYDSRNNHVQGGTDPSLWASSCSWLCKVKFDVCFLCLCLSSTGKILYEAINQQTPAEAPT